MEDVGARVPETQKTDGAEAEMSPNEWAMAGGLQPEERTAKYKKTEASTRDRIVYRVTSVRH